MSKFYPVLISLAVVACTNTTGQNSCRVALAADIPFRVADHHLMVDATINKGPATLVFDTGSFTTTLTAEAVARLHMHTDSAFFGHVEGIGGSRALSLVEAKTFDLGGLHANNFHFVSAESGMVLPGHADGLLSTDLLSHYDIDLDYGSRRIRFYYPLSDCTHPTAALDPPLYPVDLAPFGINRTVRVTVTIGGQSFRAELDSGAPHTVMFRGAAARLGLHIRDLGSDTHGMTGGIGPRGVAAVRHVVEAMTIGDLTVEHLPVAIIDQSSPGEIDMLLGLDFQSRVHLWISYSSGTLIMQYPPRTSPVHSKI